MSNAENKNQEESSEYSNQSNEIGEIHKKKNEIENDFDLAADLEISDDDEDEIPDETLTTSASNINIANKIDMSDAEDEGELQYLGKLVNFLLTDKDMNVVSDTAAEDADENNPDPHVTNNDIVETNLESSNNIGTKNSEDNIDSNPKRVLRKKPPVNYFLHNQHVKSSLGETTSHLAIGELKLRLQLPGLFSLNIEIPPQGTKALSNFYNSLKGKFWVITKQKKVVWPKNKRCYDCLICGERYARRDFIIIHLNRHMGYHVARCRLCMAKFFSIRSARKHEKTCIKVHRPELVV